MEALISRIFIQNWPRKLIALLVAVVVWLFVNHSINETKTIPGVPIRVINIPAEKTIVGLLPNGILSKRIALTLTGSRNVIRELESGDLEILVDASLIDRDEWVLHLTKKNVVSLNPAIDLSHHIQDIKHTEYIIHMSKLITAKIPIHILSPKGEPPLGYEFLDVWPQRLVQTVTGPEEFVTQLKAKGIDLTFDLNEITKADLDAITELSDRPQDDEVSFLVPLNWKEIPIVFHNNALEEINDPEAQNLRIDFLRKDFIALETSIPLQVFYPVSTLATLNPLKFKLAPNETVKDIEGAFVLIKPLYAYQVSRLFLDIVKENLAIVIEASSTVENEMLPWSSLLVNPKSLEDQYVMKMQERTPESFSINGFQLHKTLDNMLRRRFRYYMHKLKLYTSPNDPLDINAFIENDTIKVKI